MKAIRTAAGLEIFVDGNEIFRILADEEGGDLPEKIGEFSVNDPGISDRIVACVNACRGIPTDDLSRASQFMPAMDANLTAEDKAKLLSDLEKAGPLEFVAIH